MSDHVLGEVLDWFNTLEEHVPGVSSKVGEILIGKIPDSKIVSVYALADAWSDAGRQLFDEYYEIVAMADPILEAWRGDGAATQFSQQWFNYLQALSASMESVNSMADGVRKFGLQIELLKFMVVLNILLLAMTIYMLVAAALASFGISLAGVPGAIAGTGWTIAKIAARAALEIAKIPLRVSLRALPRLGMNVTPRLTQAVAPAVTTRGLALTLRGLPAVVRTRLPTIAWNQLPQLMRSAPGAIGSQVANFGRNLPGNLARQFLPKNVIARHTADRLAMQWMRSAASKELLKQLAREGAISGVTRSSLAGTRSALAWHLEQQLLRKYGTNVATGTVARGAATSVGRLGGSTLGRQITTDALSQAAARMTAEVGFGRELAKYLGGRVALGVGFMGGGNLLGQLFQIADGNRVSLDWGELGMATGQGAVFGGAMWGGGLGQGLGSGLATGVWAAGVEWQQAAAEGRDFDWGKVGTEAAKGASAGAMFGLMEQAQLARLNLPSTFKHEVVALPDPNTGGIGLVGRDFRSGTDFLVDSQSVSWRPSESGIAGEWNSVFRDGARGSSFIPDNGSFHTADASSSNGPQQASVAELLSGNGFKSDGAPPGSVTPGPDGGGPQQPGSPTTVVPPGPTPATPGPTAASPTGPAAATSTGPTSTTASGSTSSPGAGARGPESGASGSGPARTGGTAGADPTPAQPVRATAPDQVITPDRVIAPDQALTPDRVAGQDQVVGPDPVVGPDRALTPGDPAVVPERGAGVPERPVVTDQPVPRETRPVEPLVEPSKPPSEMHRADADAPPARLRDAVDSDSPPVTREPGDPIRRPAENAPEAVQDAPERAARPDSGEVRTSPDHTEAHRPPATVDSQPPPVRHEPTGHGWGEQPGEPTRPVAEPMLQAAGAETGEPPSPRSIEQGTVRMEEHPDFPRVLEEIDGHGYSLVHTDGDPRVAIRHVVDRQGNVLAVENEVHVRPGMRFLDLEHELGHVRQMTDPHRFPNGPLPSEFIQERPDGVRVKAKTHGPKLKEWQNAVIEYHVRLEEFIRLAERGVDSAVLHEHASGVDQWRNRYHQQLGRGRLSENRPEWSRNHFPEIPELERRAGQLRAEPGRPGPDGPPEGQSRPPTHRSDAPPERGPAEPDASSADNQESASGARIRPKDAIRAIEWAEEAYGRFRASDADIPDIARNLATVDRPNGGKGFSTEEIAQIKQHLMFDEHLLDDYEGGHYRSRFDADEDIAEAWIRLRSGEFVDADLVLLEHELAESNYLRAHPEATYREAHEHANSLYNWSRVTPERTGEDLDILWGKERGSGDTYRLPEGPGGQSGGRIRFWPFRRSEPEAGGREAVAGGETAGRGSGQGLHQGLPEDRPVPPDAWPVAGEGGVPSVIGEPSPPPPSAPPPAHPPPASALGPAWFAPPEEGLSVPVIGADQVQLPPAHHTPPADPHAITPEWVRNTLDDPATSPEQARWVREHLAEPGEDGRARPRSTAEMNDTLARLQGEAARAVQWPDPDPGPPHDAMTPEAEPRHPLTLDEYWADPPWQREQRRPSLDELIPATDGEAARFADQIRQEFARQFDGQEFAGMRLRLDLTDEHSVSVYRNDVTVRLEIVDPELGRVGQTIRTFHRDYDGDLFVEHNVTRLSDDAQGRGFASEWNRYLEEWYRYSGVDRIEIHAASKVGGFAWARAGYDWAPHTEHRANAVFDRLRAEMRDVQDEIALVERWRAGEDVNIQDLRQRYGVDDPDALATELRRQYDGAQEVLDRAARHPFGRGDYPTPFEVAHAGWDGQQGREATWIGKRALLGADWKGVKPISEVGTQFPRPPLVERPGAHPSAHPSAQPGGLPDAQPDTQPGVQPGEVDPEPPQWWIHAEEMSGFPGHGGHQDPDGNLAAVRDAAWRLEAEQADLITDYQLQRVSDPAHGDLLLAQSTNPRLPTVAFTFDSGPVLDGKVARTVPTSLTTADQVPIYQITISDTIPVPDRTVVARRSVAHEVGELLEALRPRRFAERLGGWIGEQVPQQWGWGRRFDPHEVGMLTELRVELEGRAAAKSAAWQSYNLRIGPLLDQLRASERMDALLTYLESHGLGEEAPLIRELSRPDVLWRAELAQQRHATAAVAVTEALNSLGADQVGLLAHGELLPEAPDGVMTARVGIRTGEGRPVETVDLPVTELVEALAGSTSVGERLRAEAVAGLTARLAEVAGGRLGQGWDDGPELAGARSLTRVRETLPAEYVGEYDRALRNALAGFNSDQLLAMRDAPLPPALRNRLPDQVTRAVFTEGLSALIGPDPGTVATRVEWRPDGELRFTGHDGKVRRVPVETIGRLQEWLRGRLAEGADVPDARAELAAVLGAQLSPYSGVRGTSSEVVGSLGALGRIWVDPELPADARAAVEAMAGEVLSEHRLQSADFDALPPPAQELVQKVPPVPRRAATTDPYAALRPGRHRELFQEIHSSITEISDAPLAARAARVADLTTAVNRMADVLQAAVHGLDERADAEVRSALEAESKAQQQRATAATERERTDRWAETRREAALKEVDEQMVIAERHIDSAARYQTAHNRAKEALDGYRLVAADLTDLAADLSTGQWAERTGRLGEYAAAASEAYRQYQNVAAEIRPVALDNAVPVMRLPHLEAQAAKLNTMLAAVGVDAVVQPEKLHRELLSRWSWVAGEDGAVIPVGDGAAQVWVRFRHGDPVEVPNPAEFGAELMLAQLPQFPLGSRVLGLTMNDLLGVNNAPDVGRIMNQLARFLPEEVVLNDKVVAPLQWVVRAVLRHMVLKFDVDLFRRWSVTGEGNEFALAGAVAATRGDLALFDVDGVWEARVRPTGSDAPWSEPARLDRGGDGDRTGLQVLVPPGYTEPAPANPVRLDQPLTERFPEHGVALSGTGPLTDTVLRLLEQVAGEVGEPTRQWVSALIQQELPARLDQAINNPGGWHRDIRSGGQPIAAVRVKTTVVREDAELVGSPSNKAPLEKLRVAFAQTSGTTAQAGRRGVGAEPGVQWVDPDDQPIVSATVPAGRGSGRSHSVSAAQVAIHPNVQRYTGHTQGYRLTLQHEVTVVKYGGERDTAPVDGHGLFRLTEPEAYRYGLPVAKQALRRDPTTDEVVRDADGHPVLRDDPIPGPPPGRLGKLPHWLGPSGSPGVGPGSVRNLTGVDAVREQLEDRLRAEGWLPTLDREGFPEVTGRTPPGLASELANVRAVAELSAARLEADYDQASQGGFQINLKRDRVGRGSEHRALRVLLRQVSEEIVGHTDAEATVNLNINRQALTVSGSETQDRSWGGKLASAVWGDQAIEVKRPTSVTSDWRTGSARHKGTLLESHGRTAIFRVRHVLEVREVNPDGGSGRLLAGGRLDGVGHGDALLVLPADMLPEAAPDPSPLPVPRPAGEVSARVRNELILLHLDGGNLPEMAYQVLPNAAHPGTAGYAHVAAFTNVRNLIANTSWMFTEYRTDHVVDRGHLAALHSSLLIKGKLHALEFQGVAQMVTAHIDFSMDAHGASVSRGKSLGVGGGGGGPVAGGSGSRTGSRGESASHESILGRERLDPVADIHYLYRFRADFDITGVEHHALLMGGDRTKSVPLTNQQAVAAIPEWVALKLYADGELPVPLERVEDALHRQRTGVLELDEPLVSRLQERLDADLAAVLDAPPEQPVTTSVLAPFSPRGAHPEAGQWRLPEQLVGALGQGGAEPMHLRDAEGRPTEPVALFDEVMRRIEAVSPNAAWRLPGLHAGLAGQFTGRAWGGMLDRMLRPGGWQFELPVPLVQFLTERLHIELSARFLPVDGEPGGGWLVGRAGKVGSILQDYGFEQSSASQSRGASYEWTGTAKKLPVVGADGPDVSGTVSRGYTNQASASSTTTRILRLSSWDGVDRFERPIEVTVKVTRQEHHPIRQLPRWIFDRFTNHGRGPVAEGVITGSVVQRVPSGLLLPTGGTAGQGAGPPAVGQPVPAAGQLVPAAGQSAPAVAGPQQTPSLQPMERLPERFAAESLDLGRLESVLQDLLSRKDLLGRTGMATHQARLHQMVSALASSPALEFMRAPGGYPIDSFPKPGAPDQRVQVFVEAELIGQRVVVPDRPLVELGHDTRQENVVREQDNRDLLLPATWSASREALPLVGTSFRKGESAEESLTGTIGDRDEYKAWQHGPGTTIAVEFDLHVTAVTKEGLSGQEVARVQVPRAARGIGYPTLFRSEQTFDQPPAVGRATPRWRIDPADPPAGWRSTLASWLGRRGRTEVVALRQVLDALAAAPGHSGKHLPEVVAEQLSRSLGTHRQGSPPLRLTAQPTVTEVDPLAVTSELARRRGGEVLLDVYGRDGGLRSYRALPDGSLAPSLPDGGFAAARAALPADLFARANEAGLDLRAVFHQAAGPGRSFPEAITDALDQSGPDAPKLFHAEADPLRKHGPARETHPTEWDDAIRLAGDLGVEVVLREGVMAYSPGLRPGEPGQLVIDPDASYGALLHELRHLQDDREAGWGGMRYWFSEPQARYEGEQRAYQEEIDYARRIGDAEAVAELTELLRRERSQIFGEDG